VVFIGVGRLTRALAPRLRAAGYRDLRVVTRRAIRGPAPGGASVLRDARDAVRGSGVVLLAVPDREISGVARALAAAIPEGWRRRVVLHHAGALGRDVLSALARLGASTGVLHPLHVLGSPAVVGRTIAGSHARVEGDGRARHRARMLCRDLGLVPFELPAATRRRREAYHAAAALAANDVVALLELAVRGLEAAGLGRRRAIAALLPLVEGALEHVRAAGIEGALTGPAARGDAGTLEAHLAVLRGISPAAEAAHRALSSCLVDLAVAAGRLAPADRAALLSVLGGRRRRGGL